MSHAPAAFTLGELRVRYHRLWRHVTDDHGLQVCGTAGQIDAVRRRLRLPYLRRHAPEVLATAKAQRWDPTEVLRVLLVEEATGRDTATRAQRRKAAGFPSGKTLDAWDTRASSIPAPTQTALATLEWVARAENLAVCGPSVDLAAAELTLEEFEKLL